MLEVNPYDRKYFEYLLGVIQGDGCIRFNYWKGKRRPSGISIAVGYDDADYAEKLIGVINNIYEVKVSVYSDANHVIKLTEMIKPYKNAKVSVIKNCSVIRVNFYNSAISRDFYKFKQNGIWSLPNLDYPHYYMAGLWDTDGYVGSSRKAQLRLSIKKSGNLELVKPILEKIGFDRVRIKHILTKNKLGIFPMELITFGSKKDITFFNKTIPLQHPRKKLELATKTTEFIAIQGRRGHKEMQESVIAHVQSHPGCNSDDIAKLLGKINSTHVTKELLRYTVQGKIRRQKTQKQFCYFPN